MIPLYGGSYTARGPSFQLSAGLVVGGAIPSKCRRCDVHDIRYVGGVEMEYAMMYFFGLMYFSSTRLSSHEPLDSPNSLGQFFCRSQK